jgi:hypothetical protein
VPAASRRPRRVPSKGNSTDDGFEHLWSVYPARGGKKRGKSEAAKEWHKLSSEERAAALADVRDRLTSDEQWRRGYPPDAHRYLRRRSWMNDEPTERPTTSDLPVVTAADRKRELDEENRKAGYRAT